jgi:hypothetical protein
VGFIAINKVKCLTDHWTNQYILLLLLPLRSTGLADLCCCKVSLPFASEPYENFAHHRHDVRVEIGVQFGDLTEPCDFGYISVARINGAGLWSLAQACGAPKNVSLDTSVLTNNLTRQRMRIRMEGMRSFDELLTSHSGPRMCQFWWDIPIHISLDNTYPNNYLQGTICTKFPYRRVSVLIVLHSYNAHPAALSPPSCS